MHAPGSGRDGSRMTDHPYVPRLTLAPRLHARLDVLLGRMRLDSTPPPLQEATASTLHAVMAQIEQAEQSVAVRPWVVALRAAQNAEPTVRALIAATPPAVLRGATPAAGVALWAWLVSQAELYCRLRIIHEGLALRDPDDSDDDDDTETFDVAANLGEELVRTVHAAEQTVLAVWQTNRYRLYRTLYTNYSRLHSYTRARGWQEETDALDYAMHLARMHGLSAYVREGRPAPAPGQPAPPRAPRLDRAPVLGRLLLDRFYWAVAGFGYRPLRAVVLNAAVVLAFALVFWGFQLLCVYSVDGARTQVNDCQAVGFVQTVYFSALAFFLAAMGEIIPRPPWGQALLVLESIWGFLNMSVVIAIILNRQHN